MGKGDNDKMNKKAYIYGGGTFANVSPHLSLCAQAFGNTANFLHKELKYRTALDVLPIWTKMADRMSNLKTNDDVAAHLRGVVNDPLTKVVVMSCALCDFSGHLTVPASGRLSSRSQYLPGIQLTPAKKLLSIVRQEPNVYGAVRKDIFLVSFKTTYNVSRQEMFTAGLNLLKESSSNLVLVNDIFHRINMIVTPEETTYHETDDRSLALSGLAEMISFRSNLTFTQSTVIAGEPVSWNSDLVPYPLRIVVDYCVKKNAYKPFKDATVGHFACKLSDTEFLTSIRKSNFNDLHKNGLVRIKTDGPDTVIAYGAKPSVGGQSQRQVFRDHPGMDCIVHFHCPLKPLAPDDIPVRSQYEVECGSHQCGKNTSEGLKQFGNLKAVYLSNHGPNIVFNKDINPHEVITFIERNFDLEKKTGGYHL